MSPQSLLSPDDREGSIVSLYAPPIRASHRNPRSAMLVVGPILARLRVGRALDWWRFNYARLRSPGRIVALGLPHIDAPFRLRMSPDATLIIGRNVRCRPGFSADIEGHGVLQIGDNTAFNVSCWIGVTTRITIGDNCLFGPFVSVTDGNHRFDDPGQLIWHQGLETREIDVGRNVWLGAKATVINDIGADAVIGANAVVTRPIAPGSVASGVPARIRRSLYTNTVTRP